jgi:hypothetical protein
MRAVLIGAAIATVIFAATGGHVFFLPLLFIPLGVVSLRRWQRHRA